MSSDNQYTALGPAAIGFQTNGANIDVGAAISGNQVGVKGSCQGPVGDGVQGFGSGNFSGTAGFGGPASGTGAFGMGGGAQDGNGGAGVRGIGAGGPNTGPAGAVGTYGQGGPGRPGVVGQAGPGIADGVQGFATGNFSGVAGFGGPNAGTGVFGMGGVGTGIGRPNLTGVGVRGIGAGGPNTGPVQSNGLVSPVGVYGQGAPGADGVRGVAGAGPGGPDPWAGVHGVAAGAPLAGLFDGNVQVNGDLHVTGAKAAVVAFPDGSTRRLYALESPESWFEDFGTGQLVAGRAEVALDPGFTAVVAGGDYHVFLTEYEDHHALYVTGRTSRSFQVVAKTSPTASSTFGYRVVAKRKDLAGRRLDSVS